MTNSLVPVDEAVTADEPKAKGGCLCDEIAIQVGTIKSGPRLGDGGLRLAEVTDTRGSAGGLDQAIVEPDHLAQREVPHAKRR